MLQSTTAAHVGLVPGLFVAGIVFIITVPAGLASVDYYLDVLSNKNQFFREAAAEGLGNLGDKRAVDPLIEALSDRQSEKVRYAAKIALEKLGYEKWARRRQTRGRETESVESVKSVS